MQTTILRTIGITCRRGGNPCRIRIYTILPKKWRRLGGAERTPEFYLLNGNGIITYRGRLDDSPKDPNLSTTSELSDAIDALLADETPNVSRTDSIGCSVKWKV